MQASFLNYLTFQGGEVCRQVNIATAKDAADLLAPEAIILEKGGHHGRRGGFHDDLHPLHDQLLGCCDFLLVDQHHVRGLKVLL